MDVTRVNEVRSTIQELFEQVLAEENIVLSRPERQRLFEQISAEILGFGPLQPLLEDETITEVMVNGAKNIYIERAGKIIRVPVSFESDEHVMRIIDRIVAPLGRRIDESSPYVDARLPDGSWGMPVNLGPGVNTVNSEYTPMLSPDGRYLFFTSGGPGSDDIYWVDASVIRKALDAAKLR